MSGDRQPKIKIILDTDIADDIDDAIALSFALGSPEFELLGVTVVYGDVETRARVARKLVRAWGRRDIPILAGYDRPFGFDWNAGTAPEQCSQRAAAADDAEPLDRSRTADQFIAETVRRFPGEVYVLTIGAMTNVAAAVCADPSLAEKMAGVVSLAGYVPPREKVPEWNVRYDPIAAQSLARSGAAWSAIGADVQGDNALARPELDAIAASDAPGMKLLAELIVLMKRHKGAGDANVKTIKDVQRCHVADVFTLWSFLIADQMDLRPGRIEVDCVGAITFAADPAGAHRLAFAKIAGTACRAEILRRLLTAPRDP